MLTRKLSGFEATLLILLTVSMMLCLVQTLRYTDIKNHHTFALKTVANLTFANQQCESVNEQCCK